ncbi:unnamed protein product, partial [Brenthis ino]
MASPDIYFKFIVFSVSLIITFKNNQASRRDLPSLINVLTQRYGSNKRPIIVIMNSQPEKDESKVYLGDSTDTSDERTAAKISHLLQHDKAFHSKKLLPLKKSTAKPHLQLKQYKYGIKKLRADRDRSLESKNVLRSPIVKKLLRISNSIQCEAKDECEDKCKNKFNGNKVIKCEMQCEVKYDCNEEEKDPCDSGDCQDSCGGSAECTMSTKGETLNTEKPSCKRC